MKACRMGIFFIIKVIFIYAPERYIIVSALEQIYGDIRMKKLSSLEPRKVFGFFEEITQIPHGSYNLEGINKYLVNFAKARNLEYIADDAGNVIIKKPATAGYENVPGIIIQGHMDMVAVCDEGSGIDMKTTPLDIFVDGDLIGAKHTSLGGDDGIAVAMALAILDSDDIPHPALDVVITANEETGMEGASGLDISNVSARRLLNIDSEDEGIFTVGCAGGARVKCTIDSDASSLPAGFVTLECKVGGLLGGHSGTMIGLGRANAGKLMGRILGAGCAVTADAVLLNLTGGTADNAIMLECIATVAVPGEYADAFSDAMMDEFKVIAKEYAETDPGANFGITKTDKADEVIKISLKKASDFLNELPFGVIAMSKDIEGLVQTSLNLGILRSEENKLTAEFSVRSSIGSERDELIDRLKGITSDFGGSNKVTGVYPGWEYRKESPLRDKMVRVFKEMYGREPKVEAIHAGLECGFFMDKASNIDAVSIGPDMQDIHTTSERLSISSTARTYDYVLKLLADKA